MNDNKKSQLTFLVSLSDAAAPRGDASRRESLGLDPLPYFCTKFNMQSAIVYLSQELQAMGLNCNLIDPTSQKVNLIAMVNAMWEVTQLYQSSVRESNTLLDQRRRDVTDISHFQSSVKDLRGSVEERERQVCDAQERERQAINVNKALSSKVKSEKEEVRRLNSVLQQREGHHQHELRKKETENNRLRERLHRLVSGERSESRPVGITVSNTLPRSGSRAKWKTEASGVRHEEEMHRKILSQYESWVGQLSDENDQLKSCLCAVTSHISKIVSRFAKNENQVNADGEMNSSMFSSDSLENPLFNLEFPAVREQVQQTLEEYLKVIVQLIEDRNNKDLVEKNDYTQLKMELEELQMELSRTKDELMTYKLSEEKDERSEKGVNVKYVEDGLFVEERAVVQKRKQDLEAERKSLQQERETFTEAAIRLNREKAAFEAEKVELLKRQFLQELPPSLSTSVDMTTSGHESAGSLSSGSLGELLPDSPQRHLAIPIITPPRRNISLTRVSTPIVLGPTRLPKQQRDVYSESSARNSLCRLKSAPVSRASSVPRQDEIEVQTNSDKEGSNIRVHHSRPSTLERRRKPNAAMAALRHRSQSQSRLELTTKHDGLYDYLPSRVEGEARLHSKRTGSPSNRYPPLTYSRESLNHFPADHKEDIVRLRVDPRTNNVSKRLTIPQSSCEGRFYQKDPPYDHHDVGEHRDPVELEDSTKLKTLENDLLNLIAKIGQRHGEAAVLSPDNPPPYEEVTPKIYKAAAHVLVSAPSSLSSSRRSSRDLSSVDDHCRRMHKQLVRK